MKTYFLIMLLSLAAVTAQAVLVDDFEDGNMNEYTQTVVLDLGGDPGRMEFIAADGQLWVTLDNYDGIEQGLCLRDDVGLSVGEILLIDTTGFVDGSQDIGLAVAATKYQTPGLRQDYISVYMRGPAQIYSRGFNGTAEFSLAGSNTGGTAVDALFIQRVDAQTFATGWISGSTGTVIAVRTVDNTDIGTAIGFYSDMRDNGSIGGLDNLELVPVPTPPVIISGPSDPPGPQTQTAVFETVFSSTSTPSVNWYRVAAPEDVVLDPAKSGIDVQLTYDEPGDAYTSTLILSDLTAADGGEYYCIVRNETGSVTSDTANLLVYGLVAHWTLDQAQFADGFYGEAVGGNDAQAAGNPVFVAGVDGTAGGAVAISADSGWALCPVLDPVRRSGQLTVSFWARSGRPAGTRQDLLAESETESLILPDGLVADGRWQHICTVFDGTTGKLYVDGVLRDEGPWQLPAQTDAAINLGVSTDGLNPFNGAMDDVRLFNYALSDTEVADLRYAQSGDSSCLAALAPAYDLSGPEGTADCVVDIYDLRALAEDFLQSGSPYDRTGPGGVPDGIVNLSEYAQLAADWLACGLYPACE